MTTKQTVLLIIGGLLIFIIGGGLGVVYQAQNGQTLEKNNIPDNTKNNSSENTCNQSPSTIVGAVKMGLNPTISITGQVTGTNGGAITLSYQGKNFNVPLAANVAVVPSGSAGLTIAKQLGINDIKIGDSLNIGLEILPDGTFIGQTVNIVSSLKK